MPTAGSEYGCFCHLPVPSGETVRGNPEPAHR